MFKNKDSTPEGYVYDYEVRIILVYSFDFCQYLGESNWEILGEKT